MKRTTRTRPEVVKILESALVTGGDDGFDDFISVELAEPELDSIRRECLDVTLAPKEVFETTLRRLLARLRDDRCS
jgi:hypothetical protein